MKAESYEKPRIDTISTSELVEMIGPVQGYGGGCGSSGVSPESVVSGGGSGPNDASF